MPPVLWPLQLILVTESVKPGGVITMEFPHLMRLIEDNQWDTIYHEHFSYFSFLTVGRVFEAHGLRLFDVECHPSGGRKSQRDASTAATSGRLSSRRPFVPASASTSLSSTTLLNSPYEGVVIAAVEADFLREGAKRLES